MSNVIGYVTADWHVPEELNGPTWRDVPEVYGDVLHALSHVVALCVSARVPLVAAGDLIDGPDVSPAALAAWFDVLRPLVDAGLPVLHVLGNHERACDWLSALGPTAVRLDGRVVTLPSGHTVSGLSYTPLPTLPAALAGVPRVTDVGVYHQATADFGPGKGMTLADLPPHPLAVVGDTHVATTIRPASGPRLALSPGPLAPRSVAEFGPPGVWAVTADLDVRRVAVPARAYHRFDVASPADADACIAAASRLVPDGRLPAHLASPMVAVRTTVDLDGFVPAVRELAAARGFSLRVLDAGPGGLTRDEAAAPARVSADLKTVIAAWPGLSPGARDLALALADGDADPAVVLDADRAAWEADPDDTVIDQDSDEAADQFPHHD